jgi:hypothetical protein
MLDVVFSIKAPSGWLSLENPAGGYEAHKDARGEQATAWRRQEISSSYVEGTYTNEAVKENVTEALAVYVYGPTPYDLYTRIKVLTDAFSQIRYQITMRTGNLLETWDCSAADYTIQTPQEMINATIAVVRATVPRRPTIVTAKV